MKLIALAAAVAACGGAQHASAPRRDEGAIAGVARDRDSGDAIGKAEIRVRADGVLGAARAATSDGKGAYQVDHLRPGRYSLSASFAGQPVDVEHIDVARGKTVIVDLTFTLGRPDPITVDFGNPKDGAIGRYHPPHHEGTGIIEGNVTDSGSRERVPGAVVTATRGPDTDSLQAISDDQGRYRIDPVPPGTYTVSAYYSVAGRAEIEIRRSDIAVAGGEGVFVPMWIETATR